MKRLWSIDELVDHCTLLPNELALLGNKTGPTRLGFAVLLKAFQLDGRFPTDVSASRIEGLSPPVWTRSYLVQAQ